MKRSHGMQSRQTRGGQQEADRRGGGGAVQQMVAVACGAAWAGLPGDLAALAAPWALTWSQVRSFSTCSRYFFMQSMLL